MNTFGVAVATTPSVVQTYLSHYLNRGPLKQKPTAHISYHEGLRLIKRFLEYASLHTIEDLQAFTAQWVPAPTWCRIQSCEIPPQFLERAAKILREQLGSRGTALVGGEKWWQWRRPETPLHAEWIEMKKDFNERKRTGTKCDRVILYVHGGAYYFGSVDEHRYQMQRHARKLKARVLAPRYRLAPQFPFPCGLYDCIATYFYLLEHFAPNQILFAGDSAGGGMVLGMLVTLRDQGYPLPAGTILLSPWVDLTHSFPSVAGEGLLDYIPPYGFHHRPSLAWPPPPTEQAQRKFTQPIEQAFDVVELPAIENLDLKSPLKDSVDSETASLRSRKKKPPPPMNRNLTPGLGEKLELEIDGTKVEIREQIQQYAKNDLLTHPLVSPVQQPSLGGLPPMLIQVGGGELLRDEQIYLAHKAADPKNYPPCDAILDDYDPRRTILKRYPPTDVQLQVWEDLCHVPHTLSFTRPAKYMYRSVAQFGAWALAHAQHKSIDIQDDDAISIISTGSNHSEDAKGSTKPDTFGSIGADGIAAGQVNLESIGSVGRAGDELPPFKDHMIRQRVNRHGLLYPLPHESEIASLHLDPATIGAIKPAPVRKWLAKRAENEKRFDKEYKRVAKKREKEAASGYDPTEEGEHPPPTALYLRRKGGSGPEVKKRGKSWGLAMWSGWGSSHDESTLEREQKVVDEKAAAEEEEQSRAGSLSTASKGDAVHSSNTNLAVPGLADKKARRISAASVLSSTFSARERDASRPRSPYTKVTDAGQATAVPSSAKGGAGGATLGNLSRKSSAASSRVHERRPMSVYAPIPVSSINGQRSNQSSLSSRVPPNMSDTGKEAVHVPGSENTYLNPDSSRPHNGIVAFPFKLRKGGPHGSPNPSTMTLDSADHSDGRSELAAGDVPAGAVELPTAFSKARGLPSESAAAPASGTVGATTTASAPAHKSSTTPFLPVGPTTPTDSTPIVPSPMSDRPVSVFPENTDLRNVKSLAEDPISPLAEEKLKPKHGKFESRDSRIGNLGADGMPIAAFPGGPAGARKDLNTATVPAPASTAAAKAADASNAQDAQPFKLRNPVHESRLDTQTPALIAAQVAASNHPAPGTPFKMRHAIHDSQNVEPAELDAESGGAGPVGPPPAGPLPAIPNSGAAAAAAAVTGSKLDASAYLAPIKVRPVTADSDVPPTPPPKDMPLRPQLETFITASEGLDVLRKGA